MSKLYANLQKLACWIKNGNKDYIAECVIECDSMIKSMLAEGQKGEVSEVIHAAMENMPKEFEFYRINSCILKGY